jgi:hypothetical protein
MTGDPKGFIPLNSLKQGEADPKAALLELREIYFKTSKQTIENDLIHAIELFKRLSEEDQDKGAMYMEGIGQMRQEWAGKKAQVKGAKPKAKNHKAKGKGRAAKT